MRVQTTVNFYFHANAKAIPAGATVSVWRGDADPVTGVLLGAVGRDIVVQTPGGRKEISTDTIVAVDYAGERIKDRYPKGTDAPAGAGDDVEAYRG